MWINYIKDLDPTGHSFMNRFGVALKREASCSFKNI